MFSVVSRVAAISVIATGLVAATGQSTSPPGAVPGATPPPSASPGATGGETGDQRQASPANQPALYTRAPAHEGLRIGSGDLLQVSVFAAEYNHEVRVAGDGTISLPLLEQVHVAGLTPSQLAADLETRFSKGGYFNNPQVEVFVKEFASQGVSVLGEVQKPGVYPLLGSRTLFDALSAAQGTTQTAGDKVYITHRDRPGQPEVVKISYDATGLAQSNVPVSPGDTIVVQKAGMVYVVGNVQKPAGIVMADGNLTVLKAIALAQGFTPNAALDKARLVRKTSDGQTAVPLQLKKMLDAKVPDMRLEPGDIVFVPNNVAASAFKKSLELALQTASGVIIYGRF